MEYSVVEAAALRPYSVYLKFKDGLEGVVDLDRLVGSGGVFDALSDINFFARMRVDDELDTIVWPNGADICPEVLYEAIKHAPNQIAALE